MLNLNVFLESLTEVLIQIFNNVEVLLTQIVKNQELLKFAFILFRLFTCLLEYKLRIVNLISPNFVTDKKLKKPNKQPLKLELISWSLNIPIF